MRHFGIITPTRPDRTISATSTMGSRMIFMLSLWMTTFTEAVIGKEEYVIILICILSYHLYIVWN